MEKNELNETLTSLFNTGVQTAADFVKKTTNEVTDNLSTGPGLKTAAIAAGLGALAYRKWKQRHPG